MTRIVQRKIEVTRTDEYGTPVEFIDQGETRRVTEVVDHWMEAGDWIRGEGQRRVYRVFTDLMSLVDLELAEEPSPTPGERYQRQWYLYRVWD